VAGGEGDAPAPSKGTKGLPHGWAPCWHWLQPPSAATTGLLPACCRDTSVLGIQQTRRSPPVPLASPAQAHSARCPVGKAAAPQPARTDGSSWPPRLPRAPSGDKGTAAAWPRQLPPGPRWAQTAAPRAPAPAASGTWLTGSICWVVLGITNCIIQKSKTTKGDRLAAGLTKGPCLEAPRAPQSPGENAV